MFNRWNVEVKHGARVEYRAGRNGDEPGNGTVQRVDRRSNFARAYGAQVTLTDGRTINADCIARSEPVRPLLSFDDALQRINDGRSIDAREVLARALSRVVWISEWHFPGCMSESRGYSLTKRDAIDACLDMAGGAEGAPRGMRADLQRYGSSRRTAPDAWARGAISTVSRCTLADLL